MWLDEWFNDVLRSAADGHNHRIVLRTSEVAQVLEGFKHGLTSLKTGHALEIKHTKCFTNRLNNLLDMNTEWHAQLNRVFISFCFNCRVVLKNKTFVQWVVSSFFVMLCWYFLTGKNSNDRFSSSSETTFTHTILR